MQISEVALLGTFKMNVLSKGDNLVPTSNNSPGSEGASNAIDGDPRTKYLNFDKLNTGFTVTPKTGSSVVTAISLTTANDAPERDPSSWKLLGSNNGSDYEVIATGLLAANSARFHTETLMFSNTKAYTSYRVLFPTLVDAGNAVGMQISEVALMAQVSGDGGGEVAMGGGNDVIIGDEGAMTFGTDGAITSVSSINPKNFGNDRIDAGTGRNVVIAGGGVDTVTVGVGESVVLGDGGVVSIAGTTRTPSKLTGHGSATLAVTAGLVTVDESTRSDALTVSASGDLKISSVMTAGPKSVVSLLSTGGTVTVAVASGSAGLIEILGSGSVLVSDVRGGVRLSKVESLNGGVEISGTGDLWVDLARVRNAAMTLNAAGDLRIGLAQATGGTLTATAGGRIEEIGSDSLADLIAKSAILKAAAGIGSLGTLEMLVRNLTVATTGGDIQLLNQTDLTLVSAINSAANGGRIVVSVEDGDLRATEVRALGVGASIQLQTLGSGDIRPGYVSADRGDVLLKAAGFIEALMVKDDAHVVGARVKLEAAAVGNEGPVNVVELNGGLKPLTGLPDLRSLVGNGWTERTYNGLTGNGSSQRMENLMTRVSTNPSGESVRLWQTGLSTPTMAAADNFGMVATGWIRASEAGNYHFWTIGDDAVQLWIYGADGKPLGGSAVASTGNASSRDQWNLVTRSAAVALEANKYYRVEVRFIELGGYEYFQVGYAKAGATTPTTPQAILGTSSTGTAAPLRLVPDFAGQAVTVTLSTDLGGLIDVGRVGAKDSSATVGSLSVPNLTIQGDRTNTVTLIGSLVDIQSFLQTEGNLRYSVVKDSWLKVSLTSARLSTTTDGFRFNNVVYKSEASHAVRLWLNGPSVLDSVVKISTASASVSTRMPLDSIGMDGGDFEGLLIGKWSSKRLNRSVRVARGVLV